MYLTGNNLHQIYETLFTYYAAEIS